MNRTTARIVSGIAGTTMLVMAGAGIAAAAPAPAAGMLHGNMTTAVTAQDARTLPGNVSAVEQTSHGKSQTPAQQKKSADKPVKFFAGPMNIRYINKTDDKVCVKAIGTRMDWKGCLQPGATSGYAQGMAWSGTDIWSDVTYSDGKTVTMWAKNPEMGYPMIGFGTGWGEHQGYKVGESADWNYGGHDFTIKRTDDGGYWKTFDITLKK